jgi:hypothetical protein
MSLTARDSEERALAMAMVIMGANTAGECIKTRRNKNTKYKIKNVLSYLQEFNPLISRAGIYGAQIFRSEDKPKYTTAFSIGIGVLALGVALAVVRYVDHLISRRRALKEEAAATDSDTGSENGRGNTAHSSPRLDNKEFVEHDSKV